MFKMVRWTFKEKRNLTLFAFSTRMFFMGVEYAVIFPSVWLYLKIFHVDYWYLGLVLSAYNMVGIVSTALVGRLVDMTRKVRFTGFLWNLAEIAGNFIYAMPFWVGLPLIGRMVAGFGEGFISAMWGELARVTTREQRTRYFTILKGSNLLGAALGPAFNLFLKEINFNIGAWPIDFRTSPGFIMGLIWIVVTILMLVAVFDLSWELKNNPDYQLLIEEPASKLKRKKKPKHSLTSPEKSPRMIKKEPMQSPGHSPPAPRKEVFPTLKQRSQPQPEDSPKRTILDMADEAIALKKLQQDESPATEPVEKSEKSHEIQEEPEDTTTKPLPDEHETVESLPNEPGTPQTPENKRNHFESFDSTSGSDAEEALDIEDADKATFKEAILDMFTKFHVVVMIYLLFFMYVIHTCLQGISPLIAENMLFWSETQVSILYTVWGLEIILVLVVVWLIAPKVSDRIILMFAVICGCGSSASLIVLSHSEAATDLCLYSFIVTILLAGAAISITVVICRSLVSKHTKPENQGLVHAILTSFNRVAGLSGPIFGSSLYTRKATMGWILAVLQVLGLVLLVLAYKKLKVVKKAEKVSS
ncbi:major facilitator superfamily domain-containing 8-like [Paramuricea clavata]|uniref:Major facilitator superfamily domain-containing 8-like n=1 Tax=Paramuricea clavata TaxID=317549 RepID=A0A6S7H696_PARCT|nr:major facilitator superfamily domain-containing 8-like [Paramuricea clavata]